MKKSAVISIGGGIAAALIVTVLAFMSQPTTSQNNLTTETDVKIKVLASFYPLYEFSKNIGGEKADVSVFIPIGIEPHDWEPSTGDLLLLKTSEVFVYNGGGMEPFVKKMIDSGEYSDVLFVETTHGIDLIKNEEHDEHEEEGDHTNEEESEESAHDHDFPYDPHIWLDPILAKEQVMAIKDALIKVDADNAQYYEDNANAYSVKLDELDSKIKTELSDCKKDTFVSFHNAFTYFANRYEIKSLPLTGMSPESEPTATELKDFIDYVRTNDIKVIFAEELVSPRLAQVLADEAGAQVMILSPLEGLSDEDSKAGKSYLDKMENNLQSLKIALECS